MKSATVYVQGIVAGKIYREEDFFIFRYNIKYIENKLPSVSFTLPLSHQPFKSKTLFPFFDGLIPEGWLLEIAVQNWKLDVRDRFSLLCTLCEDCIGFVSVVGNEK